MIRKAELTDVDSTAACYDEVLRWEEVHGSLSGWRRGIYPVRATAERAALEGTLYVAEEDGRVTGSIILNEKTPAEYEGVRWRLPAAPGRILIGHTLCVLPGASGQGLGAALLHFAESYGASHGYEVFRFDTWAGNSRAQALYRRLGFSSPGRGPAFFQGRWETELLYFEKKL